MMPLTLLLSAVAALIAVRWVYFKLLQIAKEKNLVDNPDARKLQKTPVPVVGGIAVFFGLVTGVLTGTAVMTLMGMGPSAMLLPLLSSMLLLLYVGAMDDMLGLSPESRMVFQILTMLALIMGSGRCVDSFLGLWGIETFSWWLGVPLTVLAGVGIINSVNMVDGVNGLSSGMCIISCSMFGTAFIWVGDVAGAMAAFSMAAAQVPFWLRNVFGMRSQMFIGDSGTMVMGGLQSWFVICMLRSDGAGAILANYGKSNMIALTLAILSVPVFDTVRVMTMRMVRGKSPFQSDKTHLHHIFISTGMSHLATTLNEILINVLIVSVWAVCVLLRVPLDWQLYMVIAASVLLVWGPYAFLSYHQQHDTALIHKLHHMNEATYLENRPWWQKMQNWLDSPAKTGASTTSPNS